MENLDMKRRLWDKIFSFNYL